MCRLARADGDRRRLGGWCVSNPWCLLSGRRVSRRRVVRFAATVADQLGGLTLREISLLMKAKRIGLPPVEVSHVDVLLGQGQRARSGFGSAPERARTVPLPGRPLHVG